MWTVIKYVLWIMLILVLIGFLIQDEMDEWDKYLSYEEKHAKRRERKLRIKIFFKKLKRELKKGLKEAWSERLAGMKEWLKKIITTWIIIYISIAVIGCVIVGYFEYFAEK